MLLLSSNYSEWYNEDRLGNNIYLRWDKYIVISMGIRVDIMDKYCSCQFGKFTIEGKCNYCGMLVKEWK